MDAAQSVDSLSADAGFQPWESHGLKPGHAVRLKHSQVYFSKNRLLRPLPSKSAANINHAVRERVNNANTLLQGNPCKTDWHYSPHPGCLLGVPGKYLFKIFFHAHHGPAVFKGLVQGLVQFTHMGFAVIGELPLCIVMMH